MKRQLRSANAKSKVGQKSTKEIIDYDTHPPISVASSLWKISSSGLAPLKWHSFDCMEDNKQNMEINAFYIAKREITGFSKLQMHPQSILS